MKKILFILPSLSIGGLEQTQVTVANALQRSGYDVTVMILHEADALKDKLDKNVRLIQKTHKVHPGKKIPYIRHKFYDIGLWETRAAPETLYRYYVGKEKYDVEIAYYHGLPVKIISGSTNTDAVHLTWVHNDFRKIKSFRNNFKNDNDVVNAYRRFDKVVCVSEQARKSFIEVIGDTGNTVTVYNMIPVADIRRLASEPIAYRYPDGGLNVILVGRLLDSHKGQRRLISVISRLRSENKRISLTLVGDGTDKQSIADMIAEKHAEDYIFMTGAHNNPFPYIKQADLLVCASYYEGFNLTVAEALALDIPVLSTDCTGPGEILDGGKYGIIVDNSEEGLYNGLKQFCDDPGLLDEYRQKAESRIDFFSEEAILKQILNLL